MKITASHKVEDCFDGSAVYEYEFAEAWDETRIKALARFGHLDYFADLPRPFFRVKAENGLFIQGVGGTHQCRAIFPRTDKEKIAEYFRKEVSMIH